MFHTRNVDPHFEQTAVISLISIIQRTLIIVARSMR